MNLIKPPKEHTQIPKYTDHTNEVINLDKIWSFKKSRETYYPDNEGIPTIRFWFGQDGFHSWFFDKNEETLRDDTYNSIVSTYEKD